MNLTRYSNRKIYAGYTQVVSFALSNPSEETVALNFRVRYFDASGATLLTQNNALDFQSGLYGYEVGIALPDGAVRAEAALLFGSSVVFSESFSVVRNAECYSVIRYINPLGGIETYGFRYKSERRQIKSRSQFTPSPRLQDVVLDVIEQPVLAVADTIPPADLEPISDILAARSIALLNPFAPLTCRADSFVFSGKPAAADVAIEFNLPYSNV